MSDTVTIDPRPTAKLAVERGKSARKTHPPASFPHRLTVCFAPDQVENLQLVKTAFRAANPTQSGWHLTHFAAPMDS
jgi:hypothetical protein